MASALSTRFIAEAVADPDTSQPDENIEGSRSFGRDWYKRKAEEAEAQPDRDYAPIASAKVGAGRLDFSGDISAPSGPSARYVLARDSARA